MRHVRVASVRISSGGAKHRLRLKIYLCRGPAYTGALNAAARYDERKCIRKILETYENEMSTMLAGRAAFEKSAPLGPAFGITTEWERNGFW